MKRTFSPSEAAFEGFRLVGRKPGLIAIWALIYLLLAAAVLAAVWAVFAPDLPSIVAQISAARTATSGGSEPAWAIPLMMRMRALQWTVQPLALIVGVVFTCAVYRAILRPRESGFAFIRFGGDELRLIALGIIYFFLGMAAMFVVIFVISIVGVSAYFAMAKGGQGDWVGLLAVLAGIAFACLAIWVSVRLSLGWVISFAERRLAIFDSWRLTKGQFWRMFGCYLLTWIFTVVLSLAVMAVLGIVVLVIGGSVAAQFQTGGTPDWNRLAPLVAPAIAVWAIVGSIVSAIARVVMTAPSAAIYRELTSTPDAAPDSGDPWAGSRSQGLVL